MYEANARSLLISSSVALKAYVKISTFLLRKIYQLGAKRIVKGQGYQLGAKRIVGGQGSSILSRNVRVSICSDLIEFS